MTNDYTVIMGDTHGAFGRLNTFVNKKQPKIILQCGDFGYWPNWIDKPKNPKYPKKPVVPKMGDTKLYFADGNHEDHWALQRLESNEVYPNVFYQKRGSVLTLDDGRNVLFMGGADSIDKHRRKLGIDWFPDEMICYSDIMNLPDPDKVKIDIVISHTVPEEFNMPLTVNYGAGKTSDGCRKVLSHILDVYKPTLWYAGHWHCFKEGYNRGCRWSVLNHNAAGDFWIKLPDIRGGGKDE